MRSAGDMLPGLLAAAVAVVSTQMPPARAADGVVAYTVTGDAILVPLAGAAGEAARGRALVLDRRRGNCLICHRVPVPEEPFQGELGPDLAGVGARLSAGQIRLRLVDAARLNPATVMPPYHRVAGLRRVAPADAGRPVLTAAEIEDIVAWLSGLAEGDASAGRGRESP